MYNEADLERNAMWPAMQSVTDDDSNMALGSPMTELKSELRDDARDVLLRCDDHPCMQ
jgi:hypothetical protein